MPGIRDEERGLFLRSPIQAAAASRLSNVVEPTGDATTASEGTPCEISQSRPASASVVRIAGRSAAEHQDGVGPVLLVEEPRVFEPALEHG